jgi:hypothetical protein
MNGYFSLDGAGFFMIELLCEKLKIHTNNIRNISVKLENQVSEKK